MAFHLCSSPHHRGPLIIIAVGIGFGLVGAIPVAVNFALGATNSGTIIGVGFIGFGLLLIVPGLLWCIVQRVMGLKKFCDCCGNGAGRDSTLCLEEAKPTLTSRQMRCSTINASFSSVHYECIKDEFREDEDIASTADNSVFSSIEAPERDESSR